MSLTIESYKLVGRNYLRRLLDQTNENCHWSNCTYCIKGNLIRAELFKSGFQTFNKKVQCWKISERAKYISVSPFDQWFFAVVVGFGKIKNYLSLLRMLLHAISLSFCSCFSIWWNKGLFVVIFVPNFSHLFS